VVIANTLLGVGGAHANETEPRSGDVVDSDASVPAPWGPTLGLGGAQH
jgi:hypothetical protein